MVEQATATRHNAPPKPGDFTICMFCAGVLEFVAHGGELCLIVPSEREIRVLVWTDPLFGLYLVSAKTAVERERAHELAGRK